MNKKIKITEVVLRDAHQSLLATRLRYEDMESTLKLIDDVGYWSVESWGGAIFDSCIRYLGEDPWERIRNIKKHIKIQIISKGICMLKRINTSDFKHVAHKSHQITNSRFATFYSEFDINKQVHIFILN